MKKQVQILTVVIILLVAAGVCFAQKATRLRFGKGATAMTATGRLNGFNESRVFVIRLRRGQTLRTEQIKTRNSARYITLAIQSPSGEDVRDADASCNNRKRLAPTEAGDYRITVSECRKADPWRGTFRLKIRVN